MRFRVENLGPLREAEVDLSKDLIVLTGPNNTGKTYVAWSLYGLLRFRPTTLYDTIEALCDRLLTPPEYQIALKELTPLWQQFASSLAADYQRDLPNCFASAVDDFQGASVHLTIPSPEAATRALDIPMRYGMRVGDKLLGLYKPGTSSLLRLVFNKWSRISSSATVSEQEDLTTPSGEDRLDIRDELRQGLFHLLCSASRLPQVCTLFPAERIAINIFARELSISRSDLVDELLETSPSGSPDMVPLELIRRRVGRYPLPIRDSLRVANDLAAISRKQGPCQDLAAELESTVLDGKVSVSELGEMVFSPNRASDRRLSVHLTASVVKSLSSIVFYLRHLARPGDFLIIDEPELNLHPDNQRKIARVLARAVNRGLKIMISTHSDYLLRELNNLVMLSRATETATRLAEELGYDRASLLRPDQVGVYLFNEGRAEAVPVTEDGFSVKTIDDEINRLNADSQRIYSELLD